MNSHDHKLSFDTSLFNIARNFQFSHRLAKTRDFRPQHKNGLSYFFENCTPSTLLSVDIVGYMLGFVKFQI